MVHRLSYPEIEKLLEQERQEAQEIEEIYESVAPVLEGLTKRDIFNPVLLRIKLAKLPKEYQKPVYALLRIADLGAPKGCFMTLNSRKIENFIIENNLEIDQDDE